MLSQNFQAVLKKLLFSELGILTLLAFSPAMALTPPKVSVQEIPFSFPKLPAEFNDIAQIMDCGIWHSKQLEQAARKNDLFYCSFNDAADKKSTLWLQELNNESLFAVDQTQLLKLLPDVLTNGQFTDISLDHQLLIISTWPHVPYGIKEWAIGWSATQKQMNLESVLQAAYVPSDGVVDGIFLSLYDIVALGNEGQLVRFNPSQNAPKWQIILSYIAAEQKMQELAQNHPEFEIQRQIQTSPPSITVNSAGDTLVHKISWERQEDESKENKGIEANTGTGVWCVAANGKLRGQHFFTSEFFNPSAITALPQGGYMIFDWGRETTTVKLNGFTFHLVTLDKNCQVISEKKGSLPPVYIKNADNGWIEDMQLNVTPAGDILLIYTENAITDEMTPPPLNAVLISSDALVKWVQPIITADNPYAWYLVKWGETGNEHLKINVSFVPEGQSALISIFNPAPLRAESMNWLKSVQDRSTDNLLPKIYRLDCTE